MQALQDACRAGALPRDLVHSEQARGQRVQALRRHDWVAYAKAPMAGPAAVLDYLAGYTHRTAIGNERLAAVDANKVRLRVRSDDKGGKCTSRWTASSSSPGCCNMCCHRLQAHPPPRAAGSSGQD